MNKQIWGIIIGLFCVNTAWAVTENLHWVVDGTITPATCESGGDIILPTTPTKTGYTFAGWNVSPTYDFSTLDYSIGTNWDATHARWKPINGSSGWTMTNELGTENSSDLSNGEWSETFSYGTVIGNARCSDTDNGKTWAQTGNPGNATTGRYCWCMATGYQPTGSDVVYSPNSPLSWVFRYNHESASDCALYCAYYCVNEVLYYSDFRQAVFGVTQ